MFEIIYNIVSFLSNIFTIIAAGIAIYIYIFKRKSIESFFNILINYSTQISLTELKTKLEKLNDLNAEDENERKEVINILNDIAGQIKGNPILREKCKILEKLTKYADNPENLNEPIKRNIVSELRENMRSIEFQNYYEILGENHE